MMQLLIGWGLANCRCLLVNLHTVQILIRELVWLAFREPSQTIMLPLWMHHLHISLKKRDIQPRAELESKHLPHDPKHMRQRWVQGR